LEKIDAMDVCGSETAARFASRGLKSQHVDPQHHRPQHHDRLRDDL